MLNSIDWDFVVYDVFFVFFDCKWVIFERVVFGNEFWWYCESDGVVNIVKVDS